MTACVSFATPNWGDRGLSRILIGVMILISFHGRCALGLGDSGVMILISLQHNYLPSLPTLQEAFSTSS